MPGVFKPFSEINPSSWKTSEKLSNSMRQFAWLNDETRDPITFQLCAHGKDVLDCPFGIQSPHGEEKTDRYNMAISVTNPDLLAFINKMDSCLKKLGVENSESWFKKTIDMDGINHFYKSALAPAINDYAALLKVKVARGEVVVEKLVVSETGESTTISCTVDDITKKSKLMVAVKIRQMWFMNNRQYGITLNATNILIIADGHDRSGNGPTSFYLGEGITSNFVHATPTIEDPPPCTKRQKLSEEDEESFCKQEVPLESPGPAESPESPDSPESLS